MDDYIFILWCALIYILINAALFSLMYLVDVARINAKYDALEREEKENDPTKTL